MLNRKTLVDILKFAVGATSIPGLFVVTRALMGLLQRLAGYRSETAELLVSGAVSSLGLSLFPKSYLNAVKTVAYMRAVQAGMIMLKTRFRHHTSGFKDNDMPEEQESTAAAIEKYAPSLFTGSCVILTVYALFHEKYAMPNSIKYRILDLEQTT